MLPGRDPYVAVAPLTEVTQLLQLGMVVLHIVLNRQAGRVEHSRIATQAEEDAGTLEGQQAR